MPRKLIKGTTYVYRHFKDKDIKAYLDEQLDNPDFRNHVQNVAANLKIAPHIVEEVLKDKAFQVLKNLQQKSLEKKRVKFRIYGYLSFETLKKSLNVKFKKS